MQIEIDNQDAIHLPSLGHMLFGTDEKCDVVLDFITDTPKKAFSIISDKVSCILEVFNQEQVFINNLEVHEMALLHPGDVISIGSQKLKLIDENSLPKSCSSAFKMVKKENLDNHLSTSVSGLRSFNKNSFGQLAIIGSKNSYTHKPFNDNDIPFSVSYIDDELTVLCKKDKSIFINGNKANYAILRNGDYITTGFSKYGVESPGTSSFSKYSPSHPKNIQLSEEYLINDNSKQSTSNSFIKNNLWWISLLAIVILTAIVLYLIKNQ